jgi:hypothetical protein
LPPSQTGRLVPERVAAQANPDDSFQDEFRRSEASPANSFQNELPPQPTPDDSFQDEFRRSEASPANSFQNELPPQRTPDDSFQDELPGTNRGRYRLRGVTQGLGMKSCS